MDIGISQIMLIDMHAKALGDSPRFVEDMPFELSYRCSSVPAKIKHF